MSLQVWLPLNGNLNNQGLLGNLTQTMAPTYVDGKLGKCMTTGGLMMTAAQTSQVLNNTAVSICFWVYIDAATGTTDGRSMLFGSDSMGANNNRKFSLFNYPTVNDLHWSWMNDAANVVFAGDVINDALPSYKWTHVAVTYQNPNGKIYINGELKTTFTGTSNSSTFAYDTTVLHNASYLRRNDFRLYDHCLSAKEVKEISKGLVCHYKLSSPGGYNLIKGNFSCTSTKDSYSSTGTVHCVLTANDILTNQGKTLTLSYRVLSSGDYTSTRTDWGATRFGIHGNIRYVNTSGSTIHGYPLANMVDCGREDGLYECSWTIPTDIKSINSPLAFTVQTRYDEGYAKPASNNDNVWYLSNVKLEWGSHHTPWCPNTEDTEYTTLGYDSNIEYDCSGFGNNATKTGTINWSSDSRRYSGSYIPANTSSYLSTTLVTGGYANSYTIAYWAKISDMTGRMAFGFGDGNRLNLYPSGVFCWNTGDSASNPFKNNGTSISYESCNGGWHHYAITGNGTTATLYIDGVRVGDATTYKGITGTKLFISGWDTGTGYKWDGGNISDFRIYATPLSAQDIKSLYQTAASVSKSGVMAAYEFVEE